MAPRTWRVLANSTVAGTDAMIWTLVEPGVAITAASLATIRPLLRRFNISGFDSLGRSTAARRGGSNPLSGANASQARSAIRKVTITGATSTEDGEVPLADLESGLATIHGGVLPAAPANTRTRGISLSRFRSQRGSTRIPSQEGLESKLALATDQQAMASADPGQLDSPTNRGRTTRESDEARRRSEMYIIEGFRVKGGDS
jgi:hypothetical protein